MDDDSTPPVDTGNECVGIASSTISVNPKLRAEVTSLLKGHHPPVDEILMEGWVAGLARRMANGELGGDLDDAAMVIGATRVFSNDNWVKLTCWLQHELHGRPPS